MKYLLDVNLLIASIWSAHQHFIQADAWIKGKEIVLCPISEMGFLRIGTNGRGLGMPMSDARTLLESFKKRTMAEFLPDDLPTLESHPSTSGQVTDHYLADLADHHGMKLATLDTGISHPAVEKI